MNIIELQDSLKDLPDSALMKEMQMPSGTAPQFLVLSELKRRKRMRDDFQRRQNADMKTVAEEVVTAAGAPQEGIMQVSRAMNPESSIAQNTGMDTAVQMPATQAPQPEQPMMMADGGVVKMQTGGVPEYAQKATFLDTVRKAVGEGTWTRQRSFWVDTLGEDAVREAESALMPFGGISDVRMDKMQDMGIFGNSPGRNIGGEGIASVATSVEQFMPEPEDPLKPTTGFGSNPAYTYETFLEENFLNDTPEAQEMFIKYKNYMNEQGPQSDPSLFTPDLDVAPEASVAPDSEPAPSFDVRSDADPRLGVNEFLGVDLASDEFKDAAETLYSEGIGSAQQEFISNQNKDFAPPPETIGLSTDVLMDEGVYLPSFADPEADAAQRTLEESFADQRANRSILKEMPGAIKAAPSIIYDAASEYLKEAFGPSEEEEVIEAETTSIPEGFTLGDGTTSEGAFSFGELAPKDTSTSPLGEKSTDKSGGTGSGVGGRIAQMLADREKSAEADKWMALAQTGMALMASKNPTLGGALGEAGLIGVGAMQKARQQYDADILDLLTLQERSSRAGSKGGLTASNMISLMDDLRKYKGDIQDRIDAINSPTNLMDEEEKARQLESLQQELFRTDIELGTYRNALRGTGSTGGQSFDVSGGSQSQGGVGFNLGTPTS
jgi:hypothetical protein